MEQIPRLVLVILTVFIGLGLLAGLGFFYSVRPPRYVSSQTPADLGWSYENVSLRTADGLKLKGWYIPRAGGVDGRRAVIVLHGYPFDKGNILFVTPFLREHYDLFLLDFRYFGGSAGSFTTLGLREWQDVVAAVDYLRGRGAASIGVWGFSLGASVGLLALTRTDDIDAVVADSPFSDIGSMTMDYYAFLPGANRLLTLYTDALARLVFGASLNDVSPMRAVQASPVPVLLVHGERDSTIPQAHFERVRQALANNEKAEFWLVDGAGHGYTYAEARSGYEARVLEFFGKHVNGLAGNREPGKLY